ncbi:MAG: ribbon-helix-helix domain-containing protein [Candidatus Micrarchaeota archaeon]
MARAWITVSARIPEKLDGELGAYAERWGYASKTEVLREALRDLLHEDLNGMRGALKGKATPVFNSVGEARRHAWNAALKKAGGDREKAYAIIDAQEKKALAGLKL